MISHQRRELIEALEQRTLLSAIPLKDGLTAALYSGSITFSGYTYFPGRDEPHGWELWRTDGTTAGTTLVKDINDTGTGVVYSSHVQSFMSFNGALLFMATQGNQLSDWGLWRTDGTEAGTQKLASNLDATNGLEREGWYLFNGKLIGIGNDGLVETDGTPAGTRMVVAASEANALVATTERLYWLSGSRFSDTYRVKSWDGITVRTEATAVDLFGTTVPSLISSFGYGIRFSYHRDVGGSPVGQIVQLAPREMVVRPYQERFHNYDRNDDVEFRRMRFYTDFDGNLRRVGATLDEDVLIHKVRRGSLTVSGERLFFIGGDNETQLCKTDGTLEGTAVVKEFSPAHPSYPFGTNSHVYFSFNDQPWRSAGNAQGTIPLASLPPSDPTITSIFGFGQHGSNILVGTWDRLWLIPTTTSPTRAPRPSLSIEVLRITGTSGNDDVRIGSFVQDGNDLTELDVLGTR